MRAHRWSRVLALVALAMLVTDWTGTDAFAHSAFKSSQPARDATIDSAPREISVSYTEPPTTDSVMRVFDGCGSDVTRDVEILNDTVTATVASGEPGRWSVEWEVISAVDGHLTKRDMSFEVAGEAECDPGAAPPEPPAEDEDSGNALLIVLVIGAIATIAGVGLAARWALKAR